MRGHVDVFCSTWLCTFCTYTNIHVWMWQSIYLQSACMFTKENCAACGHPRLYTVVCVAFPQRWKIWGDKSLGFILIAVLFYTDLFSKYKCRSWTKLLVQLCSHLWSRPWSFLSLGCIVVYLWILSLSQILIFCFELVWHAGGINWDVICELDPCIFILVSNISS